MSAKRWGALLVLLQCGDIATTLLGGLEHEGNPYVLLALLYVPFWVVAVLKIGTAVTLAVTYGALLWLDVPSLVLLYYRVSVGITAAATACVCVWNLYCCTTY